MTEDGRLIRLYPVPSRLMDDTTQFRKWEWIEAEIHKTNSDHRRESHRIRIDTLERISDPLPTSREWLARRAYLDRLELFTSFAALDRARVERGVTLGLLKPAKIIALEITEARHPEWTPDELAKLSHAQSQGNLIGDPGEAALRPLRKLPHDFHYFYEDADGTPRRHKISDWEAGALYWNVTSAHGRDWQAPFRARLEASLLGKDLMFLMGTLHRFEDQWLIVSLIYPPMRRQASLL